MSVLDAIDGSIEKWRKIVHDDGEDRGVHNCPLCQMFYFKMPSCEGCPIKQFTKKPYCDNTPYVNLSALTHGMISNIEDKAEREHMLFWSKEELEFLRKIKEWYIENNKEDT